MSLPYISPIFFPVSFLFNSHRMLPRPRRQSTIRTVVVIVDFRVVLIPLLLGHPVVPEDSGVLLSIPTVPKNHG